MEPKRKKLSLTSRNVPEDLYEEVLQCASRSHRSVSREIQYLLHEALNRRNGDLSRRRRILSDIDSLERSLEPDFLRFL